MSIWTPVCNVSDIPPLGSRVVEHSEGNLAIIRAEGDRIYAIEDKCPHRQGPLSQGIVHGDQVTCPLHNWVFELATGQAVGPDDGCLTTFEVQVVGEEIRVLL